MKDKKPTYEEIEQRIAALSERENHKEQNDIYHSLFSQSLDAIYLHDMEGRILDANEMACHQTGYAKEELLRMTVFDLLPDAIEKDEITSQWREWKSGQGVTSEETHRMKSGQHYFVESSTCKTEHANKSYILAIVRNIAERKNSETRLKESERRLSLVMDGSQFGYWDWNIITGEVKRNNHWAEMLGYTLEEIKFNVKQWTDLHHPDDREAAWKSINDHLNGVTSIHRCEYRMLAKDGNYRWILDQAKVVERDENGKPIRMSGTHTDITDRKQIEEELKISQQQFKGAFDHSAIGMALVSSDGRFLSVNESVCEIVGYCEKDLLRKTFQDITHPDDLEIDLSYVNQMLEGTIDTYQMEKRYIHRDGRIVWVLLSVSLVKHSDGTPNYFVSQIEDITGRKKTESNLRESESQIKLIIDMSPAFIAYVSIDDLCYRFVNKKFEDAFGLSKEEFRGKHIRNVIGDANYEFALPYIEKVRSGLPASYENYFDTEMGRRYVQVNYVPDIGDNGNVRGIVVMSHDITDRKNMEAAQKTLHEQEKHASIGKVAGKMAHDFNNILGIMLGTSELLLSEDLPESQKREIEVIKENAIRGKEITQNLLFFAKEQELKYTQVNLNEKVDLVLKAMRKDLKGVKVHIDYGVNLEEVILDEGLVHNMLINLLQNSIHAMSKTEFPELTVSTGKENKSVYIEVTDNGCGIPRKYHEMVFAPNFTLKGSMDKTGAYSKDIKGSGYGLANVKKAIEKHGGKIFLESDEGKGARIKVEIPAFDIEVVPEERGQTDSDITVNGKNVLVVEDELSIGNILSKLLRKLDCKATLVTTGKEALDRASLDTFDVISLDYMLPDINGIEVYRKIRETNKEVPVIFVSGNFEFLQSMINLKESDRKVDHIAKPFSNVDYMNKINEWLVEN